MVRTWSGRLARKAEQSKRSRTHGIRSSLLLMSTCIIEATSFLAFSHAQSTRAIGKTCLQPVAVEAKLLVWLILLISEMNTSTLSCLLLNIGVRRLTLDKSGNART